ncbi:MAG: Uma2 family endonuclease [Gemmatimonadaceae bacterium]
MPATARRWTADDVRALPADRNRYEVIEGELYVTPAPTFRHQDALGVLHFAMSLYLRDNPIGMVLFAPTDVEFESESMVQPDLFVLPLVEGRKPRSVKEAEGLLLAVEVLSPSTARLDRHLKRRLYQRFGVVEYWIVDLDARVVERWLQSEERPEIVTDELSWHPPGAVHPFVLPLPGFFEVL